MRAVQVRQCGDPEVMRVENLPDPVPGANQAVVRVYAAGVNPVDTYIRSGSQGYAPQLPYTPGSNAAGVVEAVGTGITGFVPGDRVYCNGTITGAYAELTLCDAAQIQPLPDRLSFSQGAGIGTAYTTAYSALFLRARAVSGETILIHGASGGVGLAALQMAVSGGMQVIGTSGTELGRSLILEQGAGFAADHNDPGHFEEILAHTGGKGADVILEMLANINLGNDLPVLAQNGRVAVIGSRGDVTITPRDLMRKNAAILGVMGTPPEETAAMYAYINDGLRSGTLTPVAGREFPLSRAADAHRRVIESPAYGRIVLLP